MPTGANAEDVNENPKKSDASNLSNKDGKLRTQPIIAQHLAKKKLDHSYRMFKNTKRRAENCPYAEQFANRSTEKLVWYSNDYLGISSHPKVTKAITQAANERGTGPSGTINIYEKCTYIEELEQELASLHEKEAAILFVSEFLARDTTLYALAKYMPECHIFFDSDNQASMIEGIKDIGVVKHIYTHNDPVDLERYLSSVDIELAKIVVFETLHSMTGEVCPLEKLCDIAHQYKAITYVDEMVALGLHGEHGAGIGEREGVMNKMDIISGSLGKAFINVGGYVTSTAAIIDMIRTYASRFKVTNPVPITILKGAITSIRILKSAEGKRLRFKHQKNVKYLRKALQDAGIPVVNFQSHIIPVQVGDDTLASQISNELIETHGHYVQAISYPMVHRGKAMLRISPTPFHSQVMMDIFVRDLVCVWKKFGLKLKLKVCSEGCEFCKKAPISKK